MSRRQSLAVSMGDPNGIGPEVLLKSLAQLQGTDSFHPVVAGSRVYLEELARDLELSIWWDKVAVIDIGAVEGPHWGQTTEAGGQAARQALEAAVEQCRLGRCHGLVTAPVSKAALRLAGFSHTGHTDFLADVFGRRVAMAFLSDYFHVLLATAHIPLAEVPGCLDTDDLVEQGELFFQLLNRLESTPPRIAVCGLNPHASENGLLGREEEQIVEPALRILEQKFGEGVFSGPHPADTLFRRARKGEFDGVVALYHDQGLIPLKMLAFDSAVNVTLGLPFVRTSPDHGTAFDIAGRGVANPKSMKNAFRRALQLVEAGAATEPAAG